MLLLKNMLKRCIKCKNVQKFEKFQISNGELHSYCRECNNEIRRHNYLKNKEKAIKYSILYNKNNKKLHQKSIKKWRHKNPDKVKQYQNTEANKQCRKKYQLGKGKLAQALRNRLRKALKTNAKKGSAVKDLGCSIAELKQYLEAQFQPGMTWENHGEWHIDHIKPLASFDLTKREELLQACHYTNLQPLWARDNQIKYNTLF